MYAHNWATKTIYGHKFIHVSNSLRPYMVWVSHFTIYNEIFLEFLGKERKTKKQKTKVERISGNGHFKNVQKPFSEKSLEQKMKIRISKHNALVYFFTKKKLLL